MTENVFYVSVQTVRVKVKKEFESQNLFIVIKLPGVFRRATPIFSITHSFVHFFSLGMLLINRLV